MRLAKWAWGELAVITVTTGALVYVAWRLHPAAIALPLGVFAVCVYFFRDPERTIPKDDQLVVAPADGMVMDITELEEPAYIGGPALRIGIFLSVFSVHVNRAPVAGTVEYLHYRAGTFKAAFHKRAADENESNAMGIRLSGKRDDSAAPGSLMPVLVRQIAGLVARRIVCDVRVGDRLAKGQRFGMIKFGSRTEIYLPAGSGFELRVKVGDKVKGGETILGRLP